MGKKDEGLRKGRKKDEHCLPYIIVVVDADAEQQHSTSVFVSVSMQISCDPSSLNMQSSVDANAERMSSILPHICRVASMQMQSDIPLHLCRHQCRCWATLSIYVDIDADTEGKKDEQCPTTPHHSTSLILLPPLHMLSNEREKNDERSGNERKRDENHPSPHCCWCRHSYWVMST